MTQLLNSNTNFLEAWDTQLFQSLTKLSNLNTNFSEAWKTQLSQSLTKLSSLNTSFPEAWNTQLSQSSTNLSEIQSTLAAEVQPYLHEYMEQLPSESEDFIQHIKSKTSLTLNDIGLLISLLLTVLSMILSQMPDKQLEKISSQNQTLIAQNEDIICSEKEKLEQAKRNEQVCTEIVRAINALTEKVEELTEISDDGDDILTNDQIENISTVE